MASTAIGPALAGDERRLDARDIYWLLAAYAFVLAPQFFIAPHAERAPWLAVACALLLTWRAAIAGLGWRHVPRVLLYALVALAVVGTWLTYRRLTGRDAGTMLLVSMLVMKLLEMRTTREVTLAIFLGLFLVVTNFFYSQTVLMAAYMLACLWLFFATMIGFNRIGSPPTLRERLVPAGNLLLWALPLTVLLFFFFPRVQGPLWRMADDQRVGRTGLSDSMTPGMISQLIKSEETAFTVRFEGPIPPPAMLYWRGPALWNTDGRTWTMQESFGRTGRFMSGPPTYRRMQQPVTYTVTSEPSDKPWLMALDVPGTLPANARLTWDYQMVAPVGPGAPQAAQGRQNYRATSFLDYLMDEPLGDAALQRALHFPPGTNPRTRALGESWRAKHADPRERLNEALRLYEREFVYTLEPPPLASNDPADEFLFTTKRGFCEHYSGSFVLLMRAAGIPARVVTGYLGGEINPYNQTLIVKQSDAHAWTEVYLPQSGWVRIDPTSAVAPTRIERGLSAAFGPVSAFAAFEAADPLGLVAYARLQWSAFNYRWNQWVIGYNTEQQRDFLARFGIEAADWLKLTQWLIGLGIALAALGGIIELTRNHLGGRKAPVERAYARFCARLAKAGLARQPHEGPRDYLARVIRARPDLEQPASEIVEAYVALRYAADTRSETLQRLQAGVARFAS